MQTVTSATPVTARLRAETRSAHDRLEGDLDLLGPGLTRDRYLRLLERFHGVHAVLEPRLDAWHVRDPRLDWPQRRKLAMLRADLVALGLPPARLASLAPCPGLPEATTTASALGVLYVVEGATLGGRLIAAHLVSAGVPEAAVHFFGSYGDDVGRRWRHWRRVCDAWVGHDQARADAVVAAAVSTFDALGRWLTPEGAAA